MEEIPCRADFPALNRRIDAQPVVYLDNAATTLKPHTVIEAITRYYSESGANIHRGKHYLGSEVSDAYEGVRVQVAQYVGAYANEVVFTRNTTEALNLVAAGLGLTAADTVVGCLDSHHSQILPWRRVAKLDLVGFDAHGRADLDHYCTLLGCAPKVVALTHSSNVTGAIAPIELMARMAKERCGAIVVLDAAQSAPHLPLDLDRLGVDFLAFSAHKMLGPTGVGCLVGRREKLATLRPLLVGGGTVDWVDRDGALERKVPHRFEAGTPAIASVLGFGAAIGYLDGYGHKPRADREALFVRVLLEQVAARETLTLLGPATCEDRCALVTFRIDGFADLSDVARALSDSYGIMCRTGRLCAQPLVDAAAGGDVLRISPYIYNSIAEIDQLFAALDEVTPLLERPSVRRRG